MNQGKVIWRSQLFPRLLLTDTMLSLYRRAYPSIKAFQPIMLQIEIWLTNNPHRIPKRNWGNLVNTFCRRQNEDAKHPRKAPSYPGPGMRQAAPYNPRAGHRSEPVSIGNILFQAQQQYAMAVHGSHKWLFE